MPQTIRIETPGGGAAAAASTVSPGVGSTGFSSGRLVYANSSGQLTNDTSAPYWDSTNNFLSIGSTAPDQVIYVERSGVGAVVKLVKEGTTGTASIERQDYSNSTLGPRDVSRKARGTISTPTPVAVGDVVQSWRQLAYSGGAFNLIGQMLSVVTGVDTATTQVGSAFTWWTQSTAVAAREVMRLNSSGHLGLGSTAPVARLDVRGLSRLSTRNSTVVGSTGAAAAPPATPVTYIATILADGSSARIPAYTT